MPIFKSTDPGVEVTYTVWHFDVDAFLEQYDEASMHPHIFASLPRYQGKWAHTLDEGKDISVQDPLMHMKKTFSNKCNYDAMIRTLYEVQQKEDKTVEEYMLHIHNVVMVIHCVYLEHLPDCGRDLKKDRFYHGLRPYLHDALSFAMVELPKREQACPMFNTLYTLVKKLEAGCRHAITPMAQKLIERSTGTTLCQQEGWQPWRRKEWHQPIPSPGRTLSQKWSLWMVSTCT